MIRPTQPPLFDDAQPRRKGVMPNASPVQNGAVNNEVPRAWRGKRDVSKAHAASNREAALIILSERERYEGLPVEWAKLVMEKN